MREQLPHMRYSGTIKTWNDERGFGFITPSKGGQEIFVHIKAFSRRGERPEVGQAVTFEVELNPQGKTRAKAVEPLRQAATYRKRPQTRSAQWGVTSRVAIPAFLVLYVAATFIWEVPVWVAGVYVVASILAFVMYSIDKSAAVAGTRRVPEGTLLLIGLSGGWPGAIVAQQVLRHKSSKASFRAAFWGTVVINVVAFLVFAALPLGELFLQRQVAP